MSDIKNIVNFTKKYRDNFNVPEIVESLIRLVQSNESKDFFFNSTTDWSHYSMFTCFSPQLGKKIKIRIICRENRCF